MLSPLIDANLIKLDDHNKLDILFIKLYNGLNIFRCTTLMCDIFIIFQCRCWLYELVTTQSLPWQHTTFNQTIFCHSPAPDAVYDSVGLLIELLNSYGVISVSLQEKSEYKFSIIFIHSITVRYRGLVSGA